MWRCLCVCSLLIVGLSPHISPAQDKDVILADWKARVAATDGVRYSVEGSVLVPKGVRNGVKQIFPVHVEGDVPPQDHSFKTKRVLLMDFRGNRARYDYRGEIFGGLRPAYQPAHIVKVFDGKQARDYRPRSGNPELRQLQGVINLRPINDEIHLVFHDRVSQILLISHGFDPRAALLRLGNIRLREPADMTLFDVAGERELDGDRLLVLTTEVSPRSTAELWIDPSQQSAVRRIRFLQTSRDTKEVGVSSDITIRVRQRPCGWLPDEITIDQYDAATGQLREHEVAKVTACKCGTSWSRDDFTIVPEPGTVIKEPGAVTKPGREY